MNDAKKRWVSVAEFFDREAGRFPTVGRGRSGWGHRLIDLLFRRSLKLRFERVIATCTPIEGRTALDIGCGPGSYAIALAKRYAERVIGIDVSRRMIELARKRAEAAGVGERCTFEVADLRDFRPDQTFDYTITMGVMDYVGDASAFIAKTLSLTGDAAFFSFPKSGGLLAWQRHLRYKRKCPLFLYSEEDVRGLFSDIAGFDFRVERLSRDWFVVCTKQRPA